MYTSNVITRNFFRLLCSGVLNDMESLEPMSLFKWRKLFGWVKNRHVEAVADKALHMYIQRKDAAVNQNIIDVFLHCIDRKGTNVMELPEVCLSNYFLNRRLMKIRNKEMLADTPDTVTLTTLNIILYNFILSLNKGMSFNAMLCLAKYLRIHCEQINYTLLDAWMRQLNMGKYAQLVGSILIMYFHFEKEKLPFVKHLDNAAPQLVTKALDVAEPTDSHGTKVWQGKLGLVHNNSSMLRNSLLNTITYAHYLPMEAISNYLHNIAQNLANIEE